MLMLLFVFLCVSFSGSKSCHVSDGLGPADTARIGQHQLPQGSEGEFRGLRLRLAEEKNRKLFREKRFGTCGGIKIRIYCRI